jgi:YgiT-type zinc finger domain-containing protein
MKCALCGGELRKREIVEEIREKDDRILVKVKAEVCEQCHERYYASGIVEKLIELKENLRKRRVSLHLVGKVYEVST